SIAKHTLCKEVEELTREKHGLHFKAKSTTAEQQEGFMMNDIAKKKMQIGGPYLWEVVMALLDSISGCHRAKKVLAANTPLFVGQEMDLGEFGGDDVGAEEDKDKEVVNSDGGEGEDTGAQDTNSSDGEGLLHPKKNMHVVLHSRMWHFS
ncbi:hypothetical protein PAXRUDRAFT_167719, partial [Paxillus rubicundulus Ve08.2h10]